jgi:hypothetical protein
MGGRGVGERWSRGGFGTVTDMSNNDVGQGGVRVYEAHEVK